MPKRRTNIPQQTHSSIRARSIKWSLGRRIRVYRRCGMRCVQLLWASAVLLLSHPDGLVECKVRNRVQKWQQRTWRARFGAGPRRDWKAAFEPPKPHRLRSRYGLSPREDDFFTPDAVPNAYSNYHYRRVGGDVKGAKGSGSTKLATSGRLRRQRGDRLKRHAWAHSAVGDPAEELKDYLDLTDLMMLGDDPNSEFVPLHPDFSQQYNIDEELEEIPTPSDTETTSTGQHVPNASGGGDKKLKEFKIVFHHRNLSGSCIHPRVSVPMLAFLVMSVIGIVTHPLAVGF